MTDQVEIIPEASAEAPLAPESLETPVEEVETPESKETPDVEANQPEVATEDVAEEPKVEDDDPFAEFTASEGRKDKAYYENLFKTDEKLKNTPHAARGLLSDVLSERDESEGFIAELGGRDVVNTLKPITQAVLNPEPTTESVEAIFDTLDAQNPKVTEMMGATYTRMWVKEMTDNPENLSPVIQLVMKNTFGEEGSQYDLNRIAELVQLAMAKDSDGDPILDLEYARSRFEEQGGQSAFRHRLELQERDRMIEQLKKPQGKAPEAATSATATIDTTVDIVKDFTPTLERLLPKLGYQPNDPFYTMAMNALKYELVNSPEAKNIQQFAKVGQYKTADGKFTLGVNNNRNQIESKVTNFIAGLKQIQASRKAASIVKTDIKQVTPSSKPVTESQAAPKAPEPRPAPPKNESWEQAMERINKAARAAASDARASAEIANGR